MQHGAISYHRAHGGNRLGMGPRKVCGHASVLQYCSSNLQTHVCVVRLGWHDTVKEWRTHFAGLAVKVNWLPVFVQYKGPGQPCVAARSMTRWLGAETHAIIRLKQPQTCYWQARIRCNATEARVGLCAATSTRTVLDAALKPAEALHQILVIDKYRQ
jgi:hypothetical protein